MFPPAPLALPTPSQRRRWVPWVVTGAAVAVILVGLVVWWAIGLGSRTVEAVAGPGPSAAASQSAELQRNQELADSLNTSIEAIPGVLSSSTRYVHDIGVSPSIRVQVTVENDTVSDDIVHQALRSVWLSKVNPLAVISIRPTVSGAANLGQERSWQLQFQDGADLEQQFGPRPS